VAGSSKDERERLEAAVQADPGAAGFPGLAELYRRAGRLTDAERVIQSGLEREPETREARIVLGLIHLDQGRPEAAAAALECLGRDALGAAGLSAEPESDDAAGTGPSDAELEYAFEAAEPDADALIDPDRVAQEAVAWADAASAEISDAHPLSAEIGAGGAFATRTMATLLEQQGDPGTAAQIRGALGTPDGAPAVARESEGRMPARNERIIQVLEGWLGNLRGDAR